MSDVDAYRRQLTELQILANYGHPIAALVLRRLRQAEAEVFAHLFGAGTGTHPRPGVRYLTR